MIESGHGKVLYRLLNVN